jgi:hypothetical protein
MKWLLVVMSFAVLGGCAPSTEQLIKTLNNSGCELKSYKETDQGKGRRDVECK